MFVLQKKILRAAHTTPSGQETPAWPVSTEGRYPPEADYFVKLFRKSDKYIRQLRQV